MLKGKQLPSSSGIYTGFKSKTDSFNSSTQIGQIKVKEHLNEITITGISYGDSVLTVDEDWSFKVTGDKILWKIERNYNNNAQLEEIAMPKWNFSDRSVWKGGILDNGGMVWCKYLKHVDDTYGVHTGGVTFWNEESGNALKITAKSYSGKNIAAKYSQSDKNEFTCTQMISDTPLTQRYELSRFVAGKSNVFGPIEVKKGKISIYLALEYINFEKEYSRGTLPGIDATAVRELMNTTGRYGVVDNNIIGANGWLTNWKCLHEPFFAQIGMALGDENYTRNMSATLNQERDLAMLADGRVLSRWHNAAGDEIPGTYNDKTGYYEAMWGYTIDSQTGYIINTSEQFELNGDLKWLKSHQASCERALNWLIKRDANHNGIFEMMNDGVADKKASDWLDIVWASYENAFVNAQMYEALRLWANCENVLGNVEMANYYHAVATKLKIAFNKPIEEGGFWSTEKKQYVYWRDKDGSTHGDNLVTPVNFAAIAFGLCDDPVRMAAILDQIENRSKAENLFHWPLCFDSFTRDEVSDGNWPFPKYENGDIFPSWGYLGIRAYAHYDKSIALKYISKLLAQYKKDGLSSQRYSRSTQLGLGEDILAGICTSITGLYRDIYGIRPKWNRMGLEPNMSEKLNGTKFSYKLRGKTYHLELSTNNYLMKTKGFSVRSRESFGADKTENKLIVYPHNTEVMKLSITANNNSNIDLTIGNWGRERYSWINNSPGNYTTTISGLVPGAKYELFVNKSQKTIHASEDGTLTLRRASKSATTFTLISSYN
ncbi:alpha-L-rhamnosidase-related protein [Pedobacter sp. PWIIR3]